MGSFLLMAVGKAFIVVALAMVVCLIFYVLDLGGYRPKPSRWAGLPAMALGIVTIFPANIGSHSLWLTAYGGPCTAPSPASRRTCTDAVRTPTATSCSAVTGR
ncbi:hypothetical protein SAMN05660733_07503 [Lentzea albidocapillata]|uniref:Uncharacterized protein n=1 Tax=Lentzea albidocapillata TaxID=40571 RepID=A0A1W2FQI5_9PSEU|nr:hypothetical protein SAMN05660733_07503 [Lentzea albidocapillata]